MVKKLLIKVKKNIDEKKQEWKAKQEENKHSSIIKTKQSHVPSPRISVKIPAQKPVGKSHIVNNMLHKTVNQTKIINNHLSKQELFSTILNKYNIKHVKTSPALLHFDDRIKKQYDLLNYSNINNSTLFFGLYFLQDLQYYLKHNGLKIIVAGGNDFIPISNSIKSKKIDSTKLILVTISKDLHSRFKTFEQQLNIHLNIVYTPDFSLLDPNIFYPIKKIYSKKIYIYDGYKKGRDVIYGRYYIKQIIQKLADKYEFILSSQLNKLPNKNMPEIYQQ